MAFTHGKNTEVVYGAHDVSGYLDDVSVTQDRDTSEVTTFGNSARAYIAGLRDGTVSTSGFFDVDGDAAFVAAVGQDAGVPLSAAPAGLSAGSRVYMGSVKTVSYDTSSAVADAVALSASFQCDGGVDNGVALTSLAAVTATGTGTSVDGAAATTAGLVAQLHVTAASGTTPTLDVIVESSANSSTWATLGTFTQATAAVSERITVAGTIPRYLRAARTVGGTDPSFTFTVTVARR